MLVEVLLGEGCITAPMSKYATYNTRICRPVRLATVDRAHLVQFMVSRIGTKYDMKNIFDMLRYFFPVPVPQRWRRRAIAFGSGDPTRAICSSMIAEAFQHVGYPILPHIERPPRRDRQGRQMRREIFHIRHHSLYAPRDFDLSPFFAVVKPTIEQGFDYRQVRWGDRLNQMVRSPPCSLRKQVEFRSIGRASDRRPAWQLDGFLALWAANLRFMSADYSLGELIADAVIHVLGITAGLVAVIGLLLVAIPTLPAPSTVSLCVYGATMLAMLSFSAAYHLIPVAGWKSRLRRFDQAAIFLKIAGTYTPFALINLGGAAGIGLAGTVWTVAVSGAAAKLFLPDGRRWLFLTLYLSLGWAGIVVIGPLASALPPAALILLGIGGGLYTLGVVFHVWTRLPYSNAIWHGFVLVATACQFFAVVVAIT